MKRGDIVKRIGGPMKYIGHYYEVAHCSNKNVYVKRLDSGRWNNSIAFVSKKDLQVLKVVQIKLNIEQYKNILQKKDVLKHELCKSWEKLFIADIVCVTDYSGRNPLYFEIFDVQKCIKINKYQTTYSGSITDRDLYIKLKLGAIIKC